MCYVHIHTYTLTLALALSLTLLHSHSHLHLHSHLLFIFDTQNEIFGGRPGPSGRDGTAAGWVVTNTSVNTSVNTAVNTAVNMYIAIYRSKFKLVALSFTQSHFAHVALLALPALLMSDFQPR